MFKLENHAKYYCSVDNCNKSTAKYSSFYSFPKNKCVQKIWIEICRSKIKKLITSNGELIKSLKICERHFEDHMFKTLKKKFKLKKYAVPTIFQNYSKKFLNIIFNNLCAFIFALIPNHIVSSTALPMLITFNFY